MDTYRQHVIDHSVEPSGGGAVDASVSEPIGERPTVRFTKKFRGERRFDYVALKSGDGYWYVTGSTHDGRRYTWKQLLYFVRSAGDSLDTIEVAIDWQPLTECAS